MTHEGRTLLWRVSIWCAREWGEAKARQDAQTPPPNPFAPFELMPWVYALQIVDDLFRGRPVNVHFGGKYGKSKSVVSS